MAPATATSTPRGTEPATPTQSLESQPLSPIATASREASGQPSQPSPTPPPLIEPSGMKRRGQGAQEAPEALIGEMVADLAARLQVPPQEITVVQVEAVTWNDSSLGCPEKGVYYLQVMTPGYRVVLSYGGMSYDYRANDSGFFRICPNALPLPSAPPPTD